MQTVAPTLLSRQPAGSEAGDQPIRACHGARPSRHLRCRRCQRWLGQSSPDTLGNLRAAKSGVARHAQHELCSQIAALQRNVKQHGLWCAGQWRGLDVAIKTVIFSSSQGDQQTQVVASEAAIASNLSHKNIVATYNHDILDVAKAVGPELGVYKFYLIQARPPLSSR